jgi:hypothetical protein
MRLIHTYLNFAYPDTQVQILRDYFSNTFLVEMFNGYFDHMGKQNPSLQKKKRVDTLEEAHSLAAAWNEEIAA